MGRNRTLGSGVRTYELASGVGTGCGHGGEIGTES